MKHCPICPLSSDRPCRGEWAPRLCDLINPTHSLYDPRYIALLDVAGEFPSLAEQAGNLIGAATRAAGAFVRGEPVRVSAEEQERRWSICLACEYLEGERCKVCGCFMQAKAWLALERCPLQPPKW